MWFGIMQALCFFLFCNKLFCFISFFAANVMMFPHYHQTEYIIISERMEVNSYNKMYEIVKTRNFKFNRTHTATNVTMILNQDFQFDLMASVQAFKFSSNEYRLFPVTFTVNVCETLENNDFGLQNVYKCGNPPRCPLQKGTYISCNWGPEYTKFPPQLPVGRYRIDVKFMLRKEETADLSWYIEIKSTQFMRF